MRILLLAILSGVVTFTTGCPQGPSKGLPGTKDSKSLVQNINNYLEERQKLFNDTIKSDPTDANGEGQRIRNDALDDVLAVIDDNYTDYISNIETHRSTADFLLDVIDLGSGAATGITKGERPNQILGIGLTAFRGGRRSAELNFYKQQTTPILITKMDDNRSTVLGDILQKRSASGANYSMKGAIRDMVNYYNAGTLVRAFTELSKATGAQAQASQARVRMLSGPVTVSAIPSLEFDQVVRQIRKQETSLARQIRNGQDLQTVRAKLQIIWTSIEQNQKFAAAINQAKTQQVNADIIEKNTNNPADVTATEYLRLVQAVHEALADDVDLNRALLGILMTANP